MIERGLALAVLFSFFAILFSCQPKLLTRPTTGAAPDSVLFYQKQDLHDPFLDAVLAQPHETVVLKKTIKPLPPPAAPFRFVPGFRVQVFASGDSQKAVQQRQSLRSLVKDTVLVVKEKGLFKVQLGNFTKRTAADSLKQWLKQNGFPGAWVVQTTVQLPSSAVLPPLPTASAAKRQTLGDSASTLNQQMFRIQVFATGDEQKAIQLVDLLKSRFHRPCSYQKEGALFKIFINGFATRTQAEAVLRQVRNSGYKDAWIVHP